MQHVSKSGTFYNVYVKNDYFYKKIDKANDGDGALDLSVDEYMNKIQASIPELKEVSKGDISIHILPESSADKSSGTTQDVADDIIGVTYAKYHLEEDQISAFKSLNCKIDVSYDRASIGKLLSKISDIYKGDAELGAKVDKLSNDPSSVDVKTKKVTTPDGLEGVSLVFDFSFDYEIADLNSEFKSGKSIFQALEPKILTRGFSVKEMLEKMIEDMKKENENTLLDSFNASKRLAGVFDEIRDAKKEKSV